MDKPGWLLILGIAAILLIVFDGWRRRHRTERNPHRGAGASSGAPATKGPEAMEASPPRAPTTTPRSPRHRGGDAIIDETVHTGSFIGPSIHVVGHVEATQPLTVAGRIEGEITLHDHGLAILAGGAAGPTVTSRRLIVDGCLNGAVHTTDSAIFHADARFDGELTAGRLRCAEGATLSGQFSIG